MKLHQLEVSKYRVLKELIAQLRFTPKDTLLEQSYRAEKLIKIIDAKKQYPYDFVCYKITEYRPKELPDKLLLGKDLISDLTLFVLQVSHLVPVEIKKLPERGIPIKSLAKELAVSEKTIRRWGRLGLAQRIARDENGKLKTVILERTWRWFEEKHEGVIIKANAFARLTPRQREVIIQEAKHLKLMGLSKYKIECRLANRFGKSRESIRYIISQYDADAPPEEKVFPHRKKITPKLIEQIYQMYKKGISVDQLGRIFDKSVPTIYRIINQYRQEYWKRKEINYFYLPDFDLPDAQMRIVETAERIIANKQNSTPLSTEEEHILFKAYNFLKWQIVQKKELFFPGKIPAHILNELDKLSEQMESVRRFIILMNQGLIASVAKRHIPGPLTFEELMSEGLGPLLKSIEKFDFTKGYKFSTYATWSIMKHFARVIGKLSSNETHYQLMEKEQFDTLVPGVNEIDAEESYRISVSVQQALSKLDEREQMILKSRFNIDRKGQPMSLSQLGRKLGVTKERIRQLESRAMEKLYSILKLTHKEEF